MTRLVVLVCVFGLALGYNVWAVVHATEWKPFVVGLQLSVLVLLILVVRLGRRVKTLEVKLQADDPPHITVTHQSGLPIVRESVEFEIPRDNA